MPKFTDNWVVDKTLFEYVNGGSCGCCGRAFFLPDGVESMIREISDLETDAANAEIKAVAQSPWPPEMREQVWSDRVRLRHKMKKEMDTYKVFWKEHGDDFVAWCRTIPPKTLKKMLQIPRMEVVDRVNHHYGIHSAFGQVLTVVTEQVAKFKDTAYPTDGRGESEVAFEKALCFDRRGGFTMKIVNKEGELQDEVLQTWLNRMASLGGPKLLDRTPRKDVDTDDEDGGADDADEGQSSAEPSFRMDRRIIRLLVARFWADEFIEKYKAAMIGKETIEPDNGGEPM